ncbi:MAG TPA: hypothetical protein VIP57_06520 [Candidatus Dormibacteraeota bacterium]
MSELEPTQLDARAAVAEADAQAAKVRRADRRLGWVLSAFAVVWVTEVSVGSLWHSPSSLIASLGIVAVGCALIIWLGVGIRAYSRTGIGWMAAAVVAFFVAHYAATVGAFVFGWWGPQHPLQPAINAAVSVIPLFVGAVVLWRR